MICDRSLHSMMSIIAGGYAFTGQVIIPFVCMGLACMVFCVSFVVSVVGDAHAAGLKSRADVSVQDASNPHPADDDIVLPMPCDMQMVFKAVEVPAQGFLWDAPLNMGSETAEGGRAYYDRRFTSAVAAPFRAADLPVAWGKALPQNATVPLFFYLMAKYEMSGLQWRAVMDPVCPSGPLTQADSRPKTDVSWYDAQDFARRYTQWLLENAPDSLPRYAGDDKNVGFVRLPTEAEWEYAARGGARVPRASFDQEEFHPLESGTTYSDYAVFRPEGAPAAYEAPLPIGSRRANPLGLYDMAGNAAEMVFDLFHFSLGGRLHGSAGGFVRKGGGFGSGEAEILPGRREEVAFFNGRGPVSASDLGLRPVLSGINTPAGGRGETLRSEWDKLGEQTVIVGGNDNPLQAIDRMLAANSPEKDNLGKLRVMIKDNNIALERQRNAAAEGVIRTALYMSETVRNYGVRFNIAYTRAFDINKMLDEAAKNKLKPTEVAQLKKALEQFEQAGRDQFVALESAVNFYKSKVEEAAQFPPEVIEYNLALLRSELKQDNLLGKNMRSNLATYSRHQKMFRAGKTAELQKKQLIRDILPDNLETGMSL